MQTRKHTAWKKNRKLGDVWGGRTFPKLADKIFNRQHNLTAPKSDDETPIYIVDNPSRDFYFPVTADEIKKTDYVNGDTFKVLLFVVAKFI